MHSLSRQLGWVVVAVLMTDVFSVAFAAQDTSCAAGAAIDYKRMVTLSNLQVQSWADAPTATGVSLAEALHASGVEVSELTTGTEIPVVLPGNVASSVFVLEREVPREPQNHTWVVLYSVAPTLVRQAMEREGIRYPWSGFVMVMDGENNVAPLRVGMLGERGALVYNSSTHTFEREQSESLLGGQPQAFGACVSCILDLVKSVICEAVADGVSCATLAGCPGAVLSALIRATFKLVTDDLCFEGDILGCANSCGLQQITLTPDSDAQIKPGNQKITVNIARGPNLGAWVLPVKQNGVPGAPQIHFGLSSQQTFNWNAAAGVYNLYAGNIPAPNTTIPGLGKSTNVRVGQSTTAVVTWQVIDGCDDGRGFRIRFFDKTHGGVFPSSGYDSIPSGGENTFTMNVPRGSNLCRGAEQDPPTELYWCYGINGDQDADYPGAGTCCYQVPASGNLDLSVRLVCP